MTSIKELHKKFEKICHSYSNDYDCYECDLETYSYECLNRGCICKNKKGENCPYFTSCTSGIEDCFYNFIDTRYDLKLKQDNHKKKVFLGGTCSNSKWRDKLIPMLNIDYFNPVVDDWDEKAYKEELRQREICDYCLYVITPLMSGTYSIAEVIDDSNKRPDKTIFCVLNRDVNKNYDDTIISNESMKPIYFSEGQMRSLDRVGKMVKRNGGQYFTSLQDVADYLNKGAKI